MTLANPTRSHNHPGNDVGAGCEPSLAPYVYSGRPCGAAPASPLATLASQGLNTGVTADSCRSLTQYIAAYQAYEARRLQLGSVFVRPSVLTIECP